MQAANSFRFQNIHPLLYRLLILAGVTLGVYLSFRFLLPLTFPFIVSYLLMRMLLPVVRFFRQRLHFPEWLSYGTTLVLFFSTVFSGLLFLLRQLWRQFQLLLTNFPVYRQLFAQMYATQTSRLCRCLDSVFCTQPGTSAVFFEEQVNLFQQNCHKLLSDHVGNLLVSCFSGSVRFFTILLIIIVCMFILCKDITPIHKAYRKSPYYDTLHCVALTLKKSGLAYFKSQGIIILVIWFLCSIGLMIIRNPYGILLGLLIAVFDAFPVLGSGLILAPWAVYQMFQGKYFVAAILFTTLILCIITRELLEAKLMGNHMGLLPFVMTASIYIGVCLFGVFGIVLGPFGTILIRSIYSLIVPS